MVKKPDLGEMSLLTMNGRAALMEGDGAKALALLSKKHDMVVARFGADSAFAGTSFIDLAEAYHMVRKQEQARSAVEKAFAIYQKLDRKDAQLDRLEETMMRIYAMQGHSFEVERIAIARIARLRDLGAGSDEDRAIAQDNLALLYLNSQRFEEAIVLLRDSLTIFDRVAGPAARNTGICCLYISRALLRGPNWEDAENLAEAEHYGRRALECAKSNAGEDDMAAAIAADELAVTVAFSVRKTQDSAKAADALSLSEWALDRFTAHEGIGGKERARSADNNRSLKRMLATLAADSEVEAAPLKDADALALPTTVFISHSYADRDALAALLVALPDYVEPVVFAPIDVEPHEFVSEKLVSGVLGADGFVFIDSPISRRSFWTAFERDLAERKQKKMFRFDPVTKNISRHHAKPRQLFVAHLFHPAEEGQVDRVMRWLIDERSFEAFADQRLEQKIPPFALQDPARRDAFLFSVRSYGAIYLLFLSSRLLKDKALCAHAAAQVANHPRSTLICWLDSPPRPPLFGGSHLKTLTQAPKEIVFSFTAPPGSAAFSANELDDLGVRMFWLLHQSRPGDWFR